MAKDKMGACMSEWKDKHPHGRAKEKMSKKDAHKQAVAACLNKTTVNEVFAQPSGHGKSAYAQSRRKCPSCGKDKDKGDFMMHKGKEICSSCKKENVSEDLNMTFKTFLNEEATDVRELIRGLPMYQELIKDKQHKPAALALARSFVQEFGNQGADRRVAAYIQDEFDDLYRNTMGKQGMNVGDWKGEEEYKQRVQQDKDLASAMDKWEQTTGMNAETGEDMPAPARDDRGRLKHGARSGMDFRPEIKQQRIAAELRGMGDDRKVVQKRAAAGPAVGDAAYAGGESKASRAAGIVSTGIEQGLKPREIKAQLRSELDMTAAGANTYYYKYKAKALAGR